MDQLPRLGKRELICLLLFTCNYVVSVGEVFSSSGSLGWATLFIVALPEPSIKLFRVYNYSYVLYCKPLFENVDRNKDQAFFWKHSQCISYSLILQ